MENFLGAPRRALFRLAWPTLMATLVQTMYNLVDTAYIGRLGSAPLAALTFSFPLFFTLVSFNIGMGVGLNAMVSRSLGAGQERDAANTALHGIASSLLCAALLFLITELFLDPLLTLLGAEAVVHKLAGDYMRIIAAGVFLMFPMYAISSIFTAQGDTITPMKIQFFTLFLNLGLDPLFIFTFKLGIKGAAIATDLALLAGLLMAAFYLKRRSRLQFSRKIWQFSPATIKELYAIGLPASLTMLLMAIYMMGINRLIAGYGTDTVAALGLVTRIDSAVIIPMVALSVSLLTLTAFFYGARQFHLLAEIIHFAMLVNIAFALGCALLMFLWPSFFLRCFTNKAEPLRLAAAYLRLEILSFPFMAITIAANRALQGLGLSLPGMVINGTRLFVVALPLASLFVIYLKYDFRLVAIAGLCGNLASSSLAYFWLKKILAEISTTPPPVNVERNVERVRLD
ncbi:MAG: MATE family efflux transporter [Deltaproteobacteria bacterium]|nr:MATE family efflux transporter [Deltaproteobacteria bacterium]